MIGGLKPYPEYRESGVPWLGRIPAHWEIRNLRTLVKVRRERNRQELPLLSVVREKGVIRRSTTGNDENHNFIPDDLSNYKLCRVGDLVINKMKAWQGSLGIAPCDGIVSPAYFVFNFEMTNRTFGQTLLRSKPYVGAFARASDGVRVGQWDLSISGMREIPVLIPPPEEQAAIVRFLASTNQLLERAIQAKKRLILLQNEQKQAIIYRAVTGGPDPNVSLKSSGIPWLADIPEHWEVLPLAVTAESIQTGPFGSQLHASEYVTGGIPVVNPSHMRDGRIQADPSVSVNRAKARELMRHALHVGDIVAARRGELGRCALVRESENGWLCGTGSLRIRPRTTVFVAAYLLLVFGSQVVRDALSLLSIGATMDNLNASMVARLRLPCPPLDEQRRIMDCITSESERIQVAANAARSEIALLREYRTRLIADLVTGQLDVREAARNLPTEVEEPEAAIESDAEDETEELLEAVEGHE